MATIYILFVDRLLQAACAAVFETATTADAIIDILSVVVSIGWWWADSISSVVITEMEASLK
jgi:hypothetical protein